MIVNAKSKVYCWGWNDNGQCGKDKDTDEVVLNQQNIKFA